MTEKKQTKSKQRVADHGEVFTAEREVMEIERDNSDNEYSR